MSRSCAGRGPELAGLGASTSPRGDPPGATRCDAPPDRVSSRRMTATTRTAASRLPVARVVAGLIAIAT